jgi:muconate cycloisomerase
MHDAAQLIAADASRVFALKPIKHGGLLSALDIATFAREMDVGLYVGCCIETGVGTAAYAHFACALPQLDYGCELFGPMMLTEDVLTEPIRYEAGAVLLPPGPGLGITVDSERVAALAQEYRVLAAQ